MKKEQYPSFRISMKSQQIKFFKSSLLLFLVLGVISMSESFAQGTKYGKLVPSTNKALITSYNYQEYEFPVINDAGTCKGVANASAKIGKVYFSQTHRLEVGYPLFFLVAERPALLQIGVTGSGNTPDVKVEAFFNGQSLGTKCLSGPTTLPASVDYSQANFTQYFSVTLPKEWIKPGLSVKVQAGAETKTFTSAQLKISPYSEVNLLTMTVDVLDYNVGNTVTAVPEDLIYNLAGSLPASVIRMGKTPFRIKAPVMISSNNTAVPVKVTTKNDLKGASPGNINATNLRLVGAFKDASGESSFSFFYGNTPKFIDGGWGGGKNFVGPEYGGVFIHEFGHALSLPHWGQGSYGTTNPGPDDYSYPYGGVSNDGGGRGDSWSFYQNVNEFIDPICRIAGDQNIGEERSDAMQRNNSCVEKRSYGEGPWDGFGDFSAIAINRNLVGATNIGGQVPYKGGSSYYHLSKQNGFATLKLDAQGNRIISRDPLQPQTPDNNEKLEFLLPKQWNVPVHYISGTAHLNYPEANLIYEPVTYTGGLPALIDPTDPATFAKLKNESSYNGYFYWDKDLTIKYTYADGTVKHALHVHASPQRDLGTDYSPWRSDLAYFGLLVPGDKPLKKVEVFKRLFNVRGTGDSRAGNINYAPNNITAANFMQGAVLLSTLNVSNPPEIAFISPKPNAILSPSASINLAVTASDSNGTVAKVDFYNGTTLLGTDTSAPFAYTWNSLAVGIYNISAIATDNDGQTAKASSQFAVAAPVCNSAARIPIVKVLGTAGSWGNDGHDKENVFDTDINTFFDAPQWLGAWAGIDAGSDYKLTNIGFYPRASWASRMVGGKFQASNSADFITGVVDIYTITTEPEVKWNCIPVNNTNSYRYFRFITPDGGNCNVSEIVFQGVKATTSPVAVATIYQHCSYSTDGYGVGLSEGNYTLSQLIAAGVLDNDISSIRVQPGYQITVYQDDNFLGSSLVLTNDNDCLINVGFNDVTSSLKIAKVVNFSKLIQAEDYSSMSGVQVENTTDVDGGKNVGYIDAGDSMQYNAITIPVSGTYLIEYRVASRNGGGEINLKIGSQLIGNRTIATTGGWQNWTTVSHTVNLNAGTYDFTLFAKSREFNINWWKITKQDAGSTTKASLVEESAIDNSLDQITVYPNPAENILNIAGLDNNSKSSASVINIQGQVLLETKINNNAIDISNLPAGIYIIKIQDQDWSIQKRFIKK